MSRLRRSLAFLVKRLTRGERLFCRGTGWFRVFGYGLWASQRPPLFSERSGQTRSLRLGSWRIRALRPEAWHRR